MHLLHDLGLLRSNQRLSLLSAFLIDDYLSILNFFGEQLEEPEEIQQSIFIIIVWL